MSAVVLALNSLKSNSFSAGNTTCLIVAAVLAVPLVVQADVVVLRDTVEGHVNIRNAPDGGAEVIGELGHGEVLPHVGPNGHRWREVRLGDGRAGLISRTWTEVTPDPPAHQDEPDRAAPTDEPALAAESEASATPEATDGPVVADAPNEVTEPGDVDRPTAVDTPEQVLERTIVEEPAAAESTDQVVEDEAVDPVVAQGSDEAPEAVEVPTVPETLEEAIDPAVQEHFVAEEAVESVATATEPEATDAPVAAGAADERLTGTPNYVVKFTESTTGGNSNIFDDGINVGIGTSEPQQPLDVNGNIQLYNRNSNVVVLTLTQATGNIGYIMHNLAGTMTIGAGSEDRIIIDRDGNVGIGTNRPAHPLEMASGANVTAGGVWTNASSARYKENITELGLEEALETLWELTPVRFNYIVDEGDEYVGFIAEDVPDLVASKDRRGLSPMDIVAVLTRALQGQQKKIDELEARLDER